MDEVGRRGPEKDAKDRGRLKRLEKKVNDLVTNDVFLDAVEEARTNKASTVYSRGALIKNQQVNVCLTLSC